MNKAQFLMPHLCTPCLYRPPLGSRTTESTDTLQTLRARAHARFESTTSNNATQMRQMTRALRQPCKYCHTSGFKGYTDKHKVSLEMMALSAEHSIRCDDCHAGKTDLTDRGNKARQMMSLSKEMGVNCEHCHLPASQFKSLTPSGRDYQETMKHTNRPSNSSNSTQKPLNLKSNNQSRTTYIC